jgi:hypothetical protein
MARRIIDPMFWSKVRQSQAAPIETKLLAGPRLFDLQCRVIRDGIRIQIPDATEETIQNEMRRRLRIQHVLDSQK